MSADDWSICPLCHSGCDDEVDTNYTVREYCEFVLNKDGTLSIWYSGKCSECGAEWEYTNENISCKKVV